MPATPRFGFFHALFGLTFLGGSHLTCMYQFEILRALGLFGGLVVVVAFALPSVVAGLWLKSNPSPRLRALGRAWEAVFEHMVLMVGVVLTLAVYWAISVGIGDGELPDDRGAFLFDFLGAAVVFAAVVYGLAAAMAAAFSSARTVRVLGWVMVALVVAVAVAGVLGEPALRRWAATHGGAFAAAITGYLAAASVATWRLFVAREPRQTSGA